MDVFDLVAKIRLDDSEYESGIGKAKGTFSNLASGVKTGLATVAKVGAAAVSAGVAGVTALTKMGVEGYAQYEQLVGGVQTLFGVGGKSLQEYAEEHGKTTDEMLDEWLKMTTGERIALNNAQNAYKTAGLSANEYMETVTSFSASLIQSLGGDTAKAANVADMAITDMSDNANKMGTSMEMIQNAYNGFAKGNYTMLDNLKLGYGGTKEEMQRLLEDAEKISGIKYDLSSFADITEAIHVMQEQMGIAGTTSREAASTIEGSLSMMKGAWQNLVVGMADENAYMDELINNFVESAATAAKNLLPRIEQTLIGIGQLITALAPVIAEALPQLAEAVLPALLQAAVSLVVALVDGIIMALPALYDALLIGVQTILVEVFGVSEEKAGEFADSVNSFFVKIKDGFMALVESAQTEGTWLNEIWTGLKDTGKALGDFFSALWDALSAAFAWCVEQINTEGTYLNTIWENIKTFISGAVDFIQGCISFFTAVLKGDWSAAWEAVKDVAQTVWDTICGIWGNIGAWFDKHVVQPVNEAIVKPIVEFFTNLWESLVSIWDWICGTVESAFLFIVNIIKFAFDLITIPFRFIWENCKEYVFDAFEWIKGKISDASEWISEKVALVWGWIRDNIIDPVKDAYEKAVEIFNDIKTAISEKITATKDKVAKIFNSIKEKIQKPIQDAKNTLSTTLDSIKKKFSSVFDGAKKIVTDAIAAIKKVFNFEWSLPGLKLPHISVSKGEAPYGIGGKGSLPSFGIEWYKKAYDNAMILSSPTIFGYSGGKFLGGGDGNGNEIVAGESYLMGLISQAVESKNERIVSLLSALLEATVGGNAEMVQALMADKTFTVGEREFARLVKHYA